MAAGAVLALPASASAIERADCDRTASPNGRLHTPLQLVRALRPGQTGCLRAGTYRSTTRIRRPGITLTAYPGERAVWRARVVVSARDVTLEGLVLDGTRGRHSLPSPTIHAPGVTIRGNAITNRSGICVHPVSRDGQVPDRFLIERNLIHRCGRLPSTNHDHGIYVGNGRGGVVRHNVIWASADRGIQLYPSARGTRVYENTVDRNGMGIHFGAAVSENVVERNVVTRSRLRWNLEAFLLTGNGNVMRANCLHTDRPGFNIQPSLGGRVILQGNHSAPLPYVGASRGDFRIAAGSPCAGLGAPADVAAAPAARR